MAADAPFLREQELSVKPVSRFIVVTGDVEVGKQVCHIFQRKSRIIDFAASNLLPHARRVIPHLRHQFIHAGTRGSSQT